MQKSSSENGARSLEHQPEQQRTYLCPLTLISGRTQREGRYIFEGEEQEEKERDCSWDEVGHDEQWWDNMVVAELVVVDEDDE